MLSTHSEQQKGWAFAAFIALCFALCFYAGEAIADLSLGTGNVFAAESYIHVETNTNGEKFSRTFTGTGDELISVNVTGSKVLVNGEEVPLDGIETSVNSLINIHVQAQGADGKDGAQGKDGAPGQDGADGGDVETYLEVRETTSEQSDPGSLHRPVSDEPEDIYPYLNELVAYVASLFAY